MIERVLVVFCGILLLTASGFGHATPLTWTIENASFHVGGGSLSGSFEYDANTNVYSNWDITTTSNQSMPGFHYSTQTAALQSGSALGLLLSTGSFFVSPNDPNYPGAFGSFELSIQFFGPLTNDGGMTAIFDAGFVSYESFFGVTNRALDPTLSNPVEIDRSGLVGTPTAAPIPEPETYAMLLAGLGLLGFTTRHRKLQLAAR